MFNPKIMIFFNFLGIVAASSIVEPPVEESGWEIDDILWTPRQLEFWKTEAIKNDVKFIFYHKHSYLFNF